ncbi:MAG: PAS domain S-box protein [Ekhidna sp.]
METKSTRKTEAQKAANGLSDDSMKKRILELEKENASLMIERDGIKAAIDQAVDAVITIDTEKRITYYNDAAVKMFGYSREEVLGQNVKMIVPEHHRSNHDNYVEDNVKTGTNKVVGKGREEKMIRKNGEEFFGLLTLSKVKTNSGFQFTAFIKDITEQVENRMRAETTKSAVDAGWASIEFTPDGIITDVNENWIATLGYDREQMVGQHHRIFCDDDYVNTSEYKQFWKDLASGKGFSGEFRRKKKGGEDLWMNASYAPVKDDSGKVIKVIKIAADITEQKLRNLNYEGQIKAIHEAQAVIEFNLDGTIITANENFLNATGYSLNEIEGKHHRIFCETQYARSEDYKEFWAKLNRGEFATGEYKRKKKSGEDLWLQAVYNPILDADGKPYKVVKFATDITDKVNALEELKRVVGVVVDEGNLKERANLSNVSGSETELLHLINQLLEGIGVPILAVSEVIEGLAKGDLTQDVNIEARGDVKNMSIGLATAMEKLNQLLSDINDTSNRIAASSEQMLVKSDQMSGTTEQVAFAISQMAEGVHDQASQIDNASKLINQVRTSAEQMGLQSDTINKAAKNGQDNTQKGLETVKKVVDSMSEIKKSANITSESINVLTQRSEEIARTLNVITDIAGQTNLLALNAAIEAARAGDAGRGFAVVAEEIRKLAEDSRTSAGDIEKVIQAVAKDISQAGKAIETMDDSVKSGNEASGEAETVFKDIDKSVGETLKISEAVQRATESQKKSIDETVINIEKIVTVSEETSSGTEEIATSSKDLSNGMQEFNSASKSLAEIATQLRNGVSKFKLKATA